MVLITCIERIRRLAASPWSATVAIQLPILLASWTSLSDLWKHHSRVSRPWSSQLPISPPPAKLSTVRRHDAALVALASSARWSTPRRTCRRHIYHMRLPCEWRLSPDPLFTLATSNITSSCRPRLRPHSEDLQPTAATTFLTAEQRSGCEDGRNPSSLLPCDTVFIQRNSCGGGGWKLACGGK